MFRRELATYHCIRQIQNNDHNQNKPSSSINNVFVLTPRHDRLLTFWLYRSVSRSTGGSHFGIMWLHFHVQHLLHFEFEVINFESTKTKIIACPNTNVNLLRLFPSRGRIEGMSNEMLQFSYVRKFRFVGFKNLKFKTNDLDFSRKILNPKTLALFDWMACMRRLIFDSAQAISAHLKAMLHCTRRVLGCQAGDTCVLSYLLPLFDQLFFVLFVCFRF